MKKILFAASECVPFVKTGGLADVVGALPKEFDKKDWDVRVILPLYSKIPEKYRNDFQYIDNFEIGCGPLNQNKYVGLFQYEYEGITYYFIDNQEYFYQDYIYSDFHFDIKRFAFFDKAVLSVLQLIDFRPDLIHCHDWQTGLIPVYLKTEFAASPFYRGIKSIMTIHNLKFQGVWSKDYLMDVSGLTGDLFSDDKLGFYKDGNMLKGGLTYADHITTVSKNYSYEIQSKYYGENLEGLLFARNHEMTGIVNGIDYDSFDPKTDENLYKNYSVEDFRKKKYVNKQKLQKELGLEEDKHKFMIAIVSRLTDQKGLNLIEYDFERLIDDNTQLVVLGTGDYKYESMFRYFADKYPDKVSANILYSEGLSRKIYAAADAFLMPSAFEPCGLSQLIALRYGAVPIVRETGGLKETVEPFNEYEHCGVGFSFTNYNADDMLYTVNYAKKIFFEKKAAWNKIVERGMISDHSWKQSRLAYEELYNYLIG
ncbi:MAG: glycogen synthase GlgA [Lachnospiraceae bacterium]|nr:glycogen synthase GlgA [Lachnospiraceae bacterium]